ncbi:hypothetical protein BH18ACT10_BH18ACT10_02030 [soil metagenome]
MPLRIYLTGRVLVEDSGTVLLDERRLMGRKGRLAFVHLVGEHLRSVSRDELAEELWLDRVPPSWVGLTRLHGAIRVKRSGSVKGVEDGQNRQALLA